MKPLHLLCPAALTLFACAAQAAMPPTGGVLGREALARLPEARLPAAAVREQLSLQKLQPLRYAVATPLALDERNGVWDSPGPGLARWRLKVHSDSARSLALKLANVQLPEGATLWFHDGEGGDAQGPFDRQSAELTKGESLQLPLVRGEHAVLEVLSPIEQRNDVRLSIVEGYHGYRDFNAASADTPKASLGEESGSCNINVVCPEGNNWRDEIRSTVLLTIDSQLFCSGNLVNNMRQDNRPLILTANHCTIRDTNILTVRAYFNSQSTSCSGNDNGRIDQNIIAGSFLARDENSDFTLFALAGTPAESFNVLYAGFDARGGIAPQSGVTMHHPSGDEKKIAVYSSPGVAEEDVQIGETGRPNTFRVDAWRINWSRGTTEGGSSGSGLWNQNKQLVGVLSGGAASCATPTQPDFFGRLERAWTANAASSGQLKAHLDPTNTGALQLASKNGNSPAPSPAPVPSPNPAPTPSPAPTSNGGSSGGSAGGTLLLALTAGALLRRRLLPAAAN